MTIETLAIVNGIGALLVVMTGYFMSIRMLIFYLKEKKRLQPVVALMSLSMGNLFLGGAVSFLFLITSDGQNNISGLTASFLIAPFIPLGIIAAMYLGFDLFNPKKKKPVMIFFLITAVIYYIAFYGFTSQMVKASDEIIPNKLADNNFSSVVLYIVYFYILSVILILAVGFYRLAKRIPEGNEKQKISYLFWGFLLFPLGCIIDATASEEVVIIGRILLAVGFIFMYKGFSH
jgi:hypothetical protein